MKRLKVVLEDERGRRYEGRVSEDVMEVFFKWREVLRFSDVPEEEALDIVMKAGFSHLKRRMEELEVGYGMA